MAEADHVVVTQGCTERSCAHHAIADQVAVTADCKECNNVCLVDSTS